MSRRPVFIAGCGAGSGPAGPAAGDPRSIPEIVLQAVEGALEDAGITHQEIDAVVTASVDILDGLTASNIAVTEVVGAVMKPEARIAADGLAAAIHGACQIWSGAYDTLLIVAHAKPSMAPYQDLMQWGIVTLTGLVPEYASRLVSSDAEYFLQAPPIPTRGHPPCRMALRQVHAELSRR